MTLLQQGHTQVDIARMLGVTAPAAVRVSIGDSHSSAQSARSTSGEHSRTKV